MPWGCSSPRACSGNQSTSRPSWRPAARGLQLPMPMTHRMLLVEDDELTCSLMRSLFAGTGLEIVEARTLAEALTLLDSRPDYLILDCTLPDGNGVEVLERVRADGLPT